MRYGAPPILTCLEGVHDAAWPMKTHQQHPASRTVHSAGEIAATPGGTGQLSRTELLATTGGLPTARLQRATLNPRTGISRVHNSHAPGRA